MIAPPQAATPKLVNRQRRQVTHRQPEPVPPEFFESSRARIAMGARDVQEVFAILARLGVSQRRIAALTGQSQSEISEIRAGRRVQSIDVMQRIADGLGTPRGWWGLAHTEDAITPHMVDPNRFAPPPEAAPRPETVPPKPATPSAPVAVWRTPEPWRPATRPSSADLAAARHLIGLLGALRASLSTRTTSSMRPSRTAGRGYGTVSKLMRSARR